MGIWRVLSATVHCDNCGVLIATLEFDAADQINIERVKVWCADCRKPKPEDVSPTNTKEDK